jgi:hypothetical protein
MGITRHTTRHRLLLALATAGGIAVAGGAWSQVPIGQLSPDGVTIKGKAVDLFGDKFVLDDGSGRILVQTGPGGQPLSINSGETVTVTGLPRDKTFDARKIQRENGDVVFAAPQPPPPPGRGPGLEPPPPSTLAGVAPPRTDGRFGVDRDSVMRVLKDAGIAPLGEPVRHPKHIEINGRNAAGKEVIVSLDRFGRLDEIEDADHDKDRVSERRGFGPAEAERLARDAGFTPRPPVEQRKRHFEILATNSKGETVELHMDFGGTIYKQVWIR